MTTGGRNSPLRNSWTAHFTACTQQIVPTADAGNPVDGDTGSTTAILTVLPCKPGSLTGNHFIAPFPMCKMAQKRLSLFRRRFVFFLISFRHFSD
jgi:hypothetical protein